MKQRTPKIVTIITLTTISLIFWVFISLYQVLRKTPNVEVPTTLLEPITPTLDVTVLNRLQEKLYFEGRQGNE